MWNTRVAQTAMIDTSHAQQQEAPRTHCDLHKRETYGKDERRVEVETDMTT